MVAWRSKLVRGLALAAVGLVAGAGWLAYQATSGAAVRQQVIAQLRKHFVGAEVALGSARLRLLGGITLDNLTLYRRDDPSQTPFLHVPAGVIYHDKEQLARGRLAIRKIKLERPRLTATRDAQGRWNLADILGPVRPDLPIPIIEIQQGTVVLEYAGAGPSVRLKLRNLSATALNQPLPLINFEGRAESPFGPVHVQGQWQRGPRRFGASIDLAPVQLGPDLVRELANVAPGLAEPVREIGGTGSVHLDLQRNPGYEPNWHHQARIEVRQARLEHRDLPLTLENIDLSAHCDDGVVTLDRLTATSGPAVVALKAQLASFLPALAPRPTPPAPALAKPSLALKPLPAEILRAPHPAMLVPPALDPVRSLELTVRRLPVTPELFARLPAAFQIYQQQYAPAGPLDLNCRLERTGDGCAVTAQLRADGMTGRFHLFPYPLHSVCGTLDLTLARGRLARLDVSLGALARDRRPVAIRGRVEGDTPAYAYDIRSAGVPIDETLLAALPAKYQNSVRRFHPRGRCDVVATITRPAGEPLPRQHYAVQLHDAGVCYDIFPYPLEGLDGALDIRIDPGTPGDSHAGTGVIFRDIRAGHAGGRVSIDGTARPTADGNHIALTIRGQGVALDETLSAAFARMRLRAVWAMFAPSGRMDFTAQVAHTERPDGRPDYDITVAPAGATVRPTFFPYTLTGLTGAFRLTPGRVVVLEPFRARHGSTVLGVNGGAVVFADGGYTADLSGLWAEPLPVDRDFVHALPPALQAVGEALDLGGTLAVRIARLYIDDPPDLPGPPTPPRIYWQGGIGFADAELRTGVRWDQVSGQVHCEGWYRGNVLEGVEGRIALDAARVFGQPVRGVYAHARIDPASPHSLRLFDLKGQLFGGQLGGQARVDFGAGVQYEVVLTAIGLRLEEIGRTNHLANNAQLSGPAKAELYLRGNGYGLDELEGGGNLHVPNGRMYNLPPLVDLLKVSALHVPDGTAFEEAHTEFRIHGRRVQVQRLDLLGSAISLGGRGELNLDGSDLAMDFYAVWGHIVQVLPPGLREVPPWLSKNLLLVHARGRLGDIRYTPEPVPALVEPVKQLAERVRVRTGSRGTEDRGQRTDRPSGDGRLWPGFRAQKDGD